MKLVIGGTSVSSISNKSSGILDVFNKTIVDLSAVNDIIDKETSAKELEIEKLQAEAKHLQSLKDKHNKVINKINSLFEE